VDCAVYYVVIEHPEGNFLFDTGFADDANTYYPKYTSKLQLYYNPWTKAAGVKIGMHADFKPENRIPNALKRIGLKIDDIDMVISSHFDMEHAGGNKYLKKSPFLVQKDHLDFAYNRPKALPYGIALYRKKDFDIGLDFETIQGDYEVVKDVVCISTPGHTKGHMSLLVRLDNAGSIIFCGDAFYWKWHYETNAYPPWWAMLSVSEFTESRLKLRHLAKLEKAKVFTPHDYEQYNREMKPKSPFT